MCCSVSSFLRGTPLKLFLNANRKPPATAKPDAKAPAEVVSITTRRIEITVEREWSQNVEANRPVENEPLPGDQPKELP